MLSTLVAVFAAAVVVAVVLSRRARRRSAARVAESTAHASKWVDRLAGQVERCRPESEPAQLSLEVAVGCHRRAADLLSRASTPAHATRVREAAVEGLHYVRAARTADGADPGAPLPPLSGSAAAGHVSESRDAQVLGREVAAAPRPSGGTPHYFPGGWVTGRPVPAGWYSEPWWDAARSGAGWPPESVDLFDALLADTPGTPYDGVDFESGLGSAPGRAVD